MKKMRLILLAILSWPLIALPATSDDPQRYQVELIVFARVNVQSTWPTPVRPPPDYSAARQLDLGGEMEPAMVPITHSSHRDWQLLPETDWMLKPESDRLQRRSDFELLIHLSWIQPAASRQQPQPVRLRLPERETTLLPELELLRGGTTQHTIPLDGTASLHRGQYLHLAVDLFYCRPRTHPPLRTQPDCWRLQQSYRVRPGRLYYYDHRQFGVLAQIREITPEPETGAL